MSALRSAIGFFLVLLGPITWKHLARQNDFGELLDSIVSTASFTLAYAAGLALTRRRLAARTLARSAAFPRGVVAGILGLALWIAFWTVLPAPLPDEIGPWWSFAINLLLGATSAVIVERAWPRGFSHAAR